MNGLEQLTQFYPAPVPSPTGYWYALQTRSRHERVAAQDLQNRGVCTFLPMLEEVHRWSDRRKKVELPLFPGYLFIRGEMSSDLREAVWFSRGVAGFVRMAGEPVPVPDEQIENVQKLLASKIPFVHHPFLTIGQRVRIRGGSLDGTEGILTAVNGDASLVVAIDTIQRSLAIRIAGYELEKA